MVAFNVTGMIYLLETGASSWRTRLSKSKPPSPISTISLQSEPVFCLAHTAISPLELTCLLVTYISVVAVVVKAPFFRW